MRPMKFSAEDVAYFQKRAEAAKAKMRIIRQKDCPRCDTADCEIAKACTSRLDADTAEHGFNDGPMCQHAPFEARRASEAELTKVRTQRLRDAGLSDVEMLKIIPPAREVPRPPRGWFAERQEEADLAEQATMMADRWISADQCKLFVLYGGVGAGKSFAAAWALAGIGNGLWVSARTVDNLEAWKEVQHRAHHIPLLVLDDLGTERQSESQWGTEQLASLLTGRLDAGLRTIVTTNLDGTAMTARYGARLRSRLNLRPQVGLLDCGKADLRALQRGYERRVSAYREAR